MNAIDVVLGLVIVAGCVRGWMDGFFRQMASIIGFVAGLFIAFMLYEACASWLAPQVGCSMGVARGAAFIFIWIAVPLLLSMVAHVLTRATEILCLGCINRLAGAVVGTIKYALIASCVLNVASLMQFISPDNVESSHLTRPITNLSGLLFDVCKNEFTQNNRTTMKEWECNLFNLPQKSGNSEKECIPPLWL